MRLSADFPTDTFQARRDWHEIFKVMKSKNPTTKTSLPSKTII